MKFTLLLALTLACFVLLTSNGHSSEQDFIPRLSISEAASIAQKELERLKASKNHYIKLIFYASKQQRYSASIEPPLPADPSDPEGKKIGMFIYLDGSVKTYATTIERRVVRPQPSTSEAEQGAAANP